MLNDVMCLVQYDITIPKSDLIRMNEWKGDMISYLLKILYRFIDS